MTAERRDLRQRVAQLSPEKRELLRKLAGGGKAGADGLAADLSGDGAAAERDRLVASAEKGPAPLSSAQERLWLLAQLDPGGNAWNVGGALLFEGELDVAALEGSLAEIVRRHESLRTRFATREGRPYQVVDPPGAQRLEVVDLGGVPESEREQRARELARAEMSRPFDLARGPLFRTLLVRLAGGRHVLVIAAHHIAGDGWSVKLAGRELVTLYEALRHGKPSPLPDLPIQYRDYAFWQRRRLASPEVARQLVYWREKLAGVEPIELPTDHPRPAVQAFQGGTEHLVLEPALASSLQELARARGASSFMLLLAAFKALLHRHSGQLDIAIGTPIVNRARPELEELVGLFLSTLVLRTDLSGDPTFEDLLRRVREGALEAYANQEVPFEAVVEAVSPERDLSRPPLFQVLFNMVNVGLEPVVLPGLDLRSFEAGPEPARFDLTFYAIESPGRIAISLIYNAGLFEAATARRLLDRLKVLLAGIAEQPGRRLSELPVLTEEERRRSLATVPRLAPRPGFREMPREALEQSLPACFEDEARRHAERVALVDSGGAEWSYARLDGEASRIASALRRDGAPDRVALLLPHGPKGIVGLLGALKAGASYVPLDAGAPAERLAWMLEDCGASHVLADEAGLARASGLGGGRVRAVSFEESLGAGNPGASAPPTTPETLAYILYTSGSTGRPKGVMQSHRNALHHVRCYTNVLGIDPGDRLSLFSTLAFDAAVMDVWGALLNGAALLPLDLRETDLEAAARWLEESGVTIYHSTPTVFRHLLGAADGARYAAVRCVVLGGEPVDGTDAELFRRRFGPGCAFVNGLGPSESTLALQFVRGPGEEFGGRRVPVGRAVEGTEVLLLAPDGRASELCGEIGIRSRHVALGYWRRPELTAAAFLPDPEGEDRRIYRTGDLGRLRLDGNLEFLGRRDDQIKIRGFRVEPGEIEAELARHPGVAAAVVRAWGEGTSFRLAAYVVPRGSAAPDAQELRRHLAARLPAYMVPSAIVTLGELPLTSTRKVDRRALPEPDWAVPAEGRSEAPRTPLEQQVADIWSEVLGGVRPGAHDSFFDLGGHSLNATRVLARVGERLGVDLSLRCLFESPTVAGLAAAVEQAVGARRGSPAAAAIPRVPRLRAPGAEGATLLPASFAQERLWFLEQLAPGGAAYVLSAGVRLTGELDGGALHRALEAIVARHETLRTRFAEQAGELVQVVAPQPTLPFEAVDLSAHLPEEREARLGAIAERQVLEPFDLTRGPLLRTRLVRLAEREHALLLSIHHIVADAWSTRVFIRELTDLYTAFRAGNPSPLDELKVQYGDFAHWQRERFRQGVLEEQLAYWRERLGGNPPRLELPTRARRAAGPDHRGALHTFLVAPELAESLRGLARREGATLFMVLLAGFKALLARYSGQRDVLVGSPIANRTRSEVEGLIGFFVNTLALRTNLSGDPSFRELVARVKETTLGAYEHQDLPFERLVQELRLERETDRNPLFDVAFALQNVPQQAAELPGLRLSPLARGVETARFELEWFMNETPGGVVGAVCYRSDLFEAETVARLAEHYQRVLESAVERPDRPLSRLELLGPEERGVILRGFNDTAAEYPRDTTVHALFEAQALRTPDAAAVRYGDDRLTYAELNRRANRLARRLRAQGVGPEVLVGVCLERSTELVVTLLAVLKAGGAYLPLDPTYPAERLAFMVEDAQARVVVTEASLRGVVPEGLALVLLIEDETEALARESEEDQQSGTRADGLAYVIYTSGSTGRPKGVAVVHRAIARLVRGSDYVRLGPDDRVAQASNASFDAATFEIWGALLNGACLVGIERERLLSPRELADELRNEGITTLFLTTALFNQMAAQVPGAFRTLRSVLFGGEAVDPRWVREVLGEGAPARLLHVYGPTENTTFSTWHHVREVAPGASTVPIGKPIANSRLHVLDRSLNPVPVGVPGEVYVGGDGLARGYLGRPELTAARFVPDAFGEPGSRLYRTGDLGQYLPDGNVEFLGRLDDQVKLRGFRVELGEIESVLARQKGIADAVVLLRPEDGDKRLVAYVTPRNGGMPSARELRTALSGRLPDYMVPSAFVVLDAIPLNANGKVDRQALLAREVTESDGADAPARTPIEEGMAEIWARTLGRPRIGRDESFFELGGHSLLATRVMSQIRETFQAEVPLRALFEAPTVAGLSRVVEQARRGGERALPPIERLASTVERPLSFAQRRLWFLDQLGAGGAYNVPWTLRLRGSLDPAALAESLYRVAARHETLRTTFPARDGQPLLRVSPDAFVPLVRVDLRDLPDQEREAEARRLAREEAQRPFDLAHGPLFRGALLHLSESDWVLCLTMHHIVSDGWSMGVLVRELGEHYGARVRGEEPVLPELPVQYGDFAHWQREWLSGAELERQLSYWRERLGGELGRLELPTDRPRPAVQSYRGATHTFEFGREVSEGIRALGQREGATLFMVLLAGWKALLQKYTGQEDVIVGSPIANRNRAEIEGLIGFFVNSLVLRTNLGGDPSFRELLLRVREGTLGAYDHQDLPFERLVEELQPDRLMSQNPLFQVAFAVQNAAFEPLALPLLTVEPFPREITSTRFDLEVHVWEAGGAAAATVFYNVDLFDAPTVERLAEHFRTLVGAAVAHPETRLSRLPLLDAKARLEVLALAQGPPGGRRPEPVHRLVEGQAARAPDAVAVRDAAGVLTYRELDRRADRLAHRLRALGVGPDVVVGVYSDRSPELVTALLAVLKAGGAYLPLDPSHPRERVVFMLEDARVGVLLIRGRLRKALPELSVPVVVMDGDFAGESDGPLACEVEAGNLAYVIYTSGSTGRPKGVELEHGGLANLVEWHRRAYALGPQDRATLVASPAFDASVWEIWPYLAAGASLHVPDEETRLHPARLLSWLAAERITHSFLPTPLAEALLREPEAERLPLRVLLTGGDRLRGVDRPGLPFRLVNHYGPTETTVVATCGDVDVSSPFDPPIGAPIDGTQAHVLDARLHPVPVGVPGELYVGGDGMGRGYRDRPALTAERFVPDPFAPAPGARLYRTGDIVRRRADGRLDFLGRRDAQVKVRGHRIELGEVEAALLRHPAVRDAAAAVREDEAGTPRLVAYVTPRTAGAAGAEDERGHVSQWQMLYEETYGQAPADPDPTFNITGWNSSYTGLPIPAEEMREWVESTVARIRARRPKRVLEIGCGTGLLLSRLAPGCERYVGTDFSAAALRHVEERILASRPWTHVSVSRRMADDFDGLEQGTFDAIVLNSVVQYFPGVDYLLRVLEGALRLVAEGGFVFVGDVRNLRLLEAYHTSVQLQQAPATLGVERLRQQILEHVDREEELVIDPGLFLALGRERPEVGRVEIAPKWGRHRNELSAYRYDAVLHRGGCEAGASAAWLEWDGLSLEGLDRLLAEKAPPALGVRGVANGRLARELEALRRLRDEASGTVAELRQTLGEGPGGPSPEDFRVLAESRGYTAQVSWARRGADGRYDVRLERKDAGATGSFPEETIPPGPWRELANDPLRSRVVADLGPRLRAVLAEQLPEAMVPTAFVVLAALPLTPNGKVDRRALPSPDQHPTGSALARVAPRSPIEEGIAAIWTEVLGRADVSVHDDFFELGGHSLLATQVVSRLRETFRVEMPLRALFEAPTVAGLAERVGRAAGDDAPEPSPIRPVPRSGSLPLSFAQERLWFLEQLYPGTTAYNMPFGVRLRGPLDASALERSLRDVVRRHESLRTTFLAIDGRPTQVVADEAAVAIEAADLRDLAPGEREGEVARRAAAFVGRPFDLARGPLLRAALLRLVDDEHVFLLVMHHVVSDGWSMGVLFRELSELYAAATSGRTATLPELPVQLADFAAWQREWLQGGVLERQLAYWRERLRDLPSLNLPTDNARPPTATFRGAIHHFRLSEALPAAIHERCRREGVTPFMVLLAGLQALLSRYSGQADVVVGTPIAGRNRREVEGLVGFFVNSLVLRTDLSGAPTFRELLARVRDTALGAYAHQDVPFERLVDELRPEREMGRNPLYQVSVSLQNAPTEGLRIGEASVAPVSFELSATRFDLELNFAEGPGGFWGAITYSTDLFEAPTIARLGGHFETLLESALEDPDRAVAELEFLTAAERRALAAANATDRDYPRGRCVHELFEAQVERTPEAVAVVLEERGLTYRELNVRANRLAHHLQGLGVGPEARIGIAMERSLEMVVGLLAILKAGGAYVPLDPGYPHGRLAFMVADAGVEVVLSQERLAATLPRHAARVVCVDADAELFAAAPDQNPRSGVTPDNLAYVIYTSGSTGRPKGAMNEHAGVVNRLLWTQEEYGLSPSDRVLQKTPFSFDVSVWEFFWPLLAGAQLVLARPGGHQDSAYLARLVEQQGITTAHFVPSMLRAFLDDPAVGRLAGLRRVLCSGEALPSDLAERFFTRQDAELHNLYGPTEAAVDVTRWACRRDDGGRVVPIGRPVANTRAYVLDAGMRPLPVGVPGELYLGGIQVGRGYLGRPELTAERFVPDPAGDDPGARLYRTGDLARLRPDGALEFLGRLDHQVKLRGFRIELGEIETSLLEHHGVREAVVVARNDAGDTRLVAYAVAAAEAPSLSELRRFLKERLPEHMVPAAFVFLPVLPLSPNGKVDRQALPAPDGARPDLDRARVAPRTRAEETLVRIWSDVLRLEAVGVHDNFFELGGDSILSIRVVARANEAGLALAPMQLFQHQTVAELAAVAGGVRELTAEQGPVSGPVAATPIQSWFFERALPEAHHFNQALVLELGEAVDPDLLRQALVHLGEHHDALRLRVRREASGWQQEIVPESAFPLTEVDLSAVPDARRTGALAEASRATQAGLDIERGPIARAALVHLGAERRARLLLAIHHLAVDGVSWGILLEDLQTAYGQLRRHEPVRLPAKTTSFQAWSERLVSYARSAPVRAELPYWAGEARPGPPGLPVDFPQGGDTVETSASFAVALDAQETSRLIHDVPSALRAEMNDVLLGALLAAAARWTGQGSLLVDLEGHGREELFPDLSVVRTVGWFTSLYPVRLTLERGARPAEAVRRVREKLRAVPRRGVGYGLLRYLGEDERTRERLRGGARADVLFNYLGRLDANVESGPLLRLAAESPGPLRGASQTRSHLLEVTAAVVGGVFRASFIYGTERYRESTVGALANGFVGALRTLAREAPTREGRGVVGGAAPVDGDEAVREVEFD